MHVVDIRHQECFGSIVIMWPTCTLCERCVVIVLFLKDWVVNLSSHVKFSNDTVQIVGLSHLKNIYWKQANDAFFLTWINKVSLKSTKCQTVNWAISICKCVKMLTILNYSTDKQDYWSYYYLSPPLHWYMTILQVRKLCEYSNPEIAFEYSYEMRIFEHSNIRCHP